MYMGATGLECEHGSDCQGLRQQETPGVTHNVSHPVCTTSLAPRTFLEVAVN